MRTKHTALRAGMAAIALLGFAGMAAAQTSQTPQIAQDHVLTIALPGGGIEQIRYAGGVAPQIYVSAAPAPTALPAMFGVGSPFAALDSISAAMDRQAARLFQEAAALSARPAQIDPAAVAAALPPGSGEYSFVSTMSGNGVCSRSIEITSSGNGAAPRVVRHTSGDCGTAGGFRVPTEQRAAPVPGNAPPMIMTRATGARPSAGRIEEAALR